MLIGFETAELRALCEDEAAAVSELGEDARYLLALLAELDSAPALADLPPGTVTPVDETSQRFVMGSRPIQLIFVLNQKKVPLNNLGQLDSSKVLRVKVMEIRRHG